jgi:hypothetical protein
MPTTYDQLETSFRNSQRALIEERERNAELLAALDRFFDAMSVGVSVTFRTAQQQRDGDTAYAALKEAHTKARA